MSVCPFCKAPSASHGPCKSCGKLASDHPSIAQASGRTLSDDFDDDEDGLGELDLGAGQAGGHGGGGSSSYDGGGMTFDDELGDEGPQSGDLELDIPQSGAHSVPDLGAHAAQSNPSLPASKISGEHPSASISGAQPAAVRSQAPTSNPQIAPPPSSGDVPPAPLSEPGGVAAAPPRAEPPKVVADPHAAMVAKYPAAPEKLWHAPKYATQVLLRQFELRQDLESLRRKRSPDVGLYERALASYDKRSFRIGMAIMGTALAIATTLFFMPVILRFANAPD
jgi:hypothetical protein